MLAPAGADAYSGQQQETADPLGAIWPPGFNAAARRQKTT